MFKKYQHVERFGTAEVENIDLGTCYIFPKIDGTNASVWLEDGQLQAGSRRRHLSLESDNAGFCEWVRKQENIISFLIDHPDLRLFGEWLVPHSLRTYRENAWRQFYIFDVVRDLEDGFEYLPYEEYQVLLEEYLIDYIPPICIIKNPTYDNLISYLEQNKFLIKDGKGAGEGIVIKNYDYKNKYGRATWAKIVTSEFKEKHTKVMGAPVKEAKTSIEEQIVGGFVTEALIEKEYSKLVVECEGWSSKYIPRLLSTIFHCLIIEESWNFVKKFKYPKIDFKRLQKLVNMEIKHIKPELF